MTVSVPKVSFVCLPLTSGQQWVNWPRKKWREHGLWNQAYLGLNSTSAIFLGKNYLDSRMRPGTGRLEAESCDLWPLSIRRGIRSISDLWVLEGRYQGRLSPEQSGPSCPEMGNGPQLIAGNSQLMGPNFRGPNKTQAVPVPILSHILV